MGKKHVSKKKKDKAGPQADDEANYSDGDYYEASESQTIYIDGICAHPGCQREIRVTHPYCRKHTREHLHLDVKLTEQFGYGVFAWREFNKGETVIEYTGEVIDEREYENRYPDGNAVFAACIYDPHSDDPDSSRSSSTNNNSNSINNNNNNANINNNNNTRGSTADRVCDCEVYIDAVRSDAGISRYINHYVGIAKRPNVEFQVQEHPSGDPFKNTMLIKAIRYIPKYQQITIDYGEHYRMSHDEHNNNNNEEEEQEDENDDDHRDDVSDASIIK